MSIRTITMPSPGFRVPAGLRRLLAAVALGMPAAATPAAPPLAERQLEALRQEDIRVATVAWRLATRAGDLCPPGGTQTGLLVHDAAQYAPAFRPVAARLFGLSAGPAVEAVVPGSAADAAGLRAGDALIAVNGEALTASAVAGKAASRTAADHAALAETEEKLARAAAQGPVRLRVRRGAEVRVLTLIPRSGCAGRVQLIPSSALDAGTDGVRISLTTRLVEFARDDDELAMLIAHEMAHVALGHPAALAIFRAGRGRPPAAETAGIRATEVEADRLGARMMIRAGYAPDRGAEIWRRLSIGRVRLHGDPTHPDWRERTRIARDALETFEKHSGPDIPATPGATP